MLIANPTAREARAWYWLTLGGSAVPWHAPWQINTSGVRTLSLSLPLLQSIFGASG